MRTIEYARAKGREARHAILGSGGDVLTRLIEHFRNTHGVAAIPMNAAQTRGARAEIDPEGRTLRYDASLSPPELAVLFAHELGHLTLHQRLFDSHADADPLFASAYGDAGASAIARYSPRGYEETQAGAFAAEFVAPSDAVWQMWCDAPNATADSLAGHFGCSVALIRAQLAHALHAVALGGDAPSASRKDVAFTPAQTAAAEFTGTAAIVDAGPGTGKTATVIRRLQHVMKERGASPRDILVLTFSNQAANELRERVATTFGDEVADAINVWTFHGFGMEFLHRHGHLWKLSERYVLLDEDRQIETVALMLDKVQCDRLITLKSPLATATRLVEHINHCKQRFLGWDAIEREVRDWKPAPEEELAHSQAAQFVTLFRAYEDTLSGAACIDFADLLNFPISVLETEPDVRAYYAKRFPWVIVDEFQDMTLSTARLLCSLCGPRNRPWMVGDVRQAIYQFAGAVPADVERLTDVFKATRFDLDVNYRSAPAIVTAANQLASLMSGTDDDSGVLKERWKCGKDSTGEDSSKSGDGSKRGTDSAVVIAEAASDAAEAEGVARWVHQRITRDLAAPGDVAVLCRSHADVRRVILALSRKGIKAQASGVLTPEGAAGDLAMLLTLADAPPGSVPRVTYALGRGRWSRKQLNTAVGELLREARRDWTLRAPLDSDFAPSIEVRRVHQTLKEIRRTADGFDTLAIFLFDDGAYLRRILAAEDSAERQMALVEIVSVLSLAASYRATHRDVPAYQARPAFAERLRLRLAKTTPVSLTPRPRTDAVHVMTCHASKGREFPYVAVMGQTVPDIPDAPSWLPPVARPGRSFEESQADALLFVSVTRAQRAVLVSFSSGATARSRTLRTVVPLLARWRDEFGIPTVEWKPGEDEVLSSRIPVGNIWNVEPPGNLKAPVLDTAVCPLLTYVETYAGVLFPTVSDALYPTFFGWVRESLRRVVRFACANGTVPDDGETRGILVLEMPDGFDHGHAKLYRDAAEAMVHGFVADFRRFVTPGMADLNAGVQLVFGDGLDVVLALVGHYREKSGKVVAILFRPEPLGKSRDQFSVDWSELSDGKKAPLALLEHFKPGIKPYVYSGSDGRIYQFLWSKKKAALPNLAGALKAQRAAFAKGDFSTDASKFQCERCRVIVSCPRWMGAVGREPNPGN